MRMPSAVFIVCTVCFLSGCVVGPNYKRPVVNAPALLRGQEGVAGPSSVSDLPWWELFQDQTLRALINTAVENNKDVRIAAARVEQARQLAVQAHSEYLPQVGYQTGISGGQNESLGNPIIANGTRQGTVALAFGAAWEADLWGRIRRLNEAALARYLESEQSRRGVLLTLVSDIARAYFELLALDLRLDIARRNVSAFEGSLKLFQQRLDGGTASRLETERARGAAAITASSIPDLERLIVLQENEISILLGSAPAPVVRGTTLLDQIVPPEVPVGLPSDLLERRPDVLEAEAAVRAANADIGVATSAFFPRVGLTALLGRVSSPLQEIVSGHSSVWGGAASAAGPIYAGRSLRAQKRRTIAFWEETRAQYEQTVLGAFRDVSNALITREKLEAVRAYQVEAVRAYQEAVQVSLQRYNAGKSSYFEVLDAQLQLFPAENALAQTELDRRVAIVQLYRALGGGWKLGSGGWKQSGVGAPGQAKP